VRSRKPTGFNESFPRGVCKMRCDAIPSYADAADYLDRAGRRGRPPAKITRQMAAAEGRSRYYDALYCDAGHQAEKLVSTGACLICAIAADEPRRHERERAPKITTTRAEAKAAGLTIYFTEQRCSRGHLSARATSDARCLACDRLRKAEKRADRADATRCKESPVV